MKLVPRASKAKAAIASPTPLTEDAAAQAMWVYYRDHKAQLITDIREHRASILAGLMAGVAVQDAFAPYVKPAELARALRRAA
jgi:hypothetical protein